MFAAFIFDQIITQNLHLIQLLCTRTEVDFFENHQLAGFICRIKHKLERSSIGKLLTFKDLDEFEDLSKGCLIGAFLGDSIGSYLDMNEEILSEELVNKALDLPGGGTFDLNPGQITEDSELSLSLMRGLIDGDGKFSLEMIVKYYKDWFFSNPFDIGETLRHSFTSLLFVHDQENYSHMVNVVTIASQKKNMKSQGNGSLMRIAPLAIWCSQLRSLDDLEIAVRLEVSLTHPNKTVQDASICYCIAIRHLMNNRSDTDGAYLKVDWWISKNCDGEILEWWDLVKKDEMIIATDNPGWIKISWIYAFNFLKRGELDYETVIRKVMHQGGDTDSNGCIVGGLIGATIGFTNLRENNQKRIDTLLKCDVTKGNQKRPERYNPIEVIKMAEKLIKIAPDVFNMD